MIYIFLQTVLIVLAWHLLAMDGRIDFYIRKMRNRFIDWRTMPKYDAAKVAVDWKYELVGTDFIKRKLAEAQAAIDDKQPDDAVFKDVHDRQSEAFNKRMDKIIVDAATPKKKPKAMTAPIIPRGYKRHDGGKCPVRKNARVDYVVNNGNKCNNIQASWIIWDNIIAYRLSKRKGG